MLRETQDDERVIARVAALDIGKAELVCCARVPQEDQPGRRLQEVETYSTMTRPLPGLADRLRCQMGPGMRATATQTATLAPKRLRPSPDSVSGEGQ